MLGKLLRTLQLSLPLDDPDEFTETPEQAIARLTTSDEKVAAAILEEANAIYDAQADRAESAERRATTLQGAVAIAASFGLSGAGFIFDAKKVPSDGWRTAFAVAFAGFIFCLIMTALRALGATSTVHRWQEPKATSIWERPQQKPEQIQVRRAAALVRAAGVNKTIARWKIAYMRAAAWWFRSALGFLAVGAALVLACALFGPTPKSAGSQAFRL
jgi:hypothetical protein